MSRHKKVEVDVDVVVVVVFVVVVLVVVVLIVVVLIEVVFAVVDVVEVFPELPACEAPPPPPPPPAARIRMTAMTTAAMTTQETTAITFVRLPEHILPLNFKLLRGGRLGPSEEDSCSKVGGFRRRNEVSLIIMPTGSSALPLVSPGFGLA